MNVKRTLAAAVAGVGGVALTNRLLSTRAGRLDPPLDGETDTYSWRGFDVATVEAGDPEDPTLVLLHGVNAAASAGEFREVFARLAETHHVVAPDLPGFGRSDRPSLRYSATLYEEFVAEFLGEYDAPAVLASGLTAAYAAAAAADGVEVESLVLVCPTAVAGPDRITALRELFRAPLVGTALFNLLVSKPSIRYFNADHGYYDLDSLSESWVDYEWQSAHQPGARYAPASFISGFLNSDRDLGEALATADAPVTLVWGREAEVTPLSDGRDLAEAADARLVVLDDAKLLPHVEFPAAVVGALDRDLPGGTHGSDQGADGDHRTAGTAPGTGEGTVTEEQASGDAD